jgi:DNA-binding transcriptional LysR family regulator
MDLTIDLPSTVEIRQFLAVAQMQSFSAAARHFGLSTAAVSATIARLEKNVSVRLFERSTRKVRLTNEGEVFLVHCQQALFHLESGVLATVQAQQGLSGHIRISAPSDLARGLLSDWLQGFQLQHPNVKVHLSVGDRVTDIVGEQIDVAVRYGIPQDSSLVARLMCDTHRVLCASPEYLDAFGTPTHPNDLKDHFALCYEVGGKVNDVWTFAYNDEQFEIKLNCIFSTDDSSLTRDWALQGRGLVYKGEIDLRNDIESGRLIPILTDFETRYTPVYLVYPSAKNVPMRTHRLIEYLLWATEQERAQ